MPRINITNSGGSLDCDAITWREGQRCNVAVRNLPLREDGPLIDTGTWVLKNKILNFEVRITDSELKTLKDIFNVSATVTITALAATSGYRWVYTAWIIETPRKYEYSKDGSGNEREWIVEINCAVSIFIYEAIP